MAEQIGKIIDSAGKTRKIGNAMPSNFIEGGKLPPQAVDLEAAVLGALMLEKGPVNDIIDILTPESFYKEAHQKIYGVIRDLFGDSEPIDILTVTQKLRSKGELDEVGGPYFISQLTNRVASAAHAEAHARIISQKHILRELIRISGTVIQKAYDETTDVFDLLDESEAELFKVAEGNLRKNHDTMSQLMRMAVEGIEEAMSREDGISGVPSSFTALDRVTSGWQKSDMVVLAARPGMGKTAFVLSMARNAAVDHNKAVAFFSLEMSSVQLVNRLISGEAEIGASDIRKGNLSKDEFSKLFERTKKLAEAPLFIDDTPALSVFELRAKCRRLKQQHDIQMVVIDYLQLMSAGGNGGNREQEISTISRSIKEIAKELDIPIIALSQLSRSVETRGGDKRPMLSDLRESGVETRGGDKRPMLSDLRESGAIEQDADIVCFIYRPEYYGLTEWADNTPCNGQGEIIIAKHRNGSLEDVRLRFIGKFAKFENLDTFDNDAGFNPMLPNPDFDTDGGGFRTVQSKMNDDTEDTFPSDFLDDSEEESPF